MQDIQNAVAQKLNAMREVSVILHYGVHDRHDIISPNAIGMPPVIDVIDKNCMGTMRGLWLKALSRKEPDVPVIEKDETLFGRFERILSKALQPRERDLTADFVAAAAFPVPPSYAVKLPLHDKDLRVEILSTLVPFEKTREMLLRLEKQLEAPMRALQIGHAPIHDVDALRASGTVIASQKLIYN